VSVIELRFKPQGEVLAEYQHSWDRVEFIMGPLGSAKTTQSCLKLFTAMCNQAPNVQGIRPTRWIAVRNTYSDLLTTTVKDWLALFEDMGRYKAGGKEPPTHNLDFRLEDGTTVQAEIIFLALDRPDDIKKLRGTQATGFWLNEVKELDKSIVDMCDLRHGRYPSMALGGVLPTWHGMIGDTNAPDEDHWYYYMAEEVRPNGWRFHRQPGGLLKQGDVWIENPEAENLGNLPGGYYVNGMQGKSEDWIKVNLGNEYGFVIDGKPVHPQYQDSVHCTQHLLEPIKGVPITVGLDFGRTPAAAMTQKLPMGRWQCFDEFTSHDISAATFAPELKRYLDGEYPEFDFVFYGDPAGDHGGQATDDTPYQILRKHGIHATPTETNSPLVRRSALTNPMMRNCMDGKPAFVISPKCKMIRKGLAGGFCYKRIQVSGERYHDEPDKNMYSHPVEALEYALQGGGEGREATVGKSNFKQPVVINNYSPFKRKRA